MDKYQPIPPKTKLSGFLFFFVVGMIMIILASISPIYYEEWDLGTAIFGIFGIISITFSFLIAKSKYQLTPESEKEAKQKTKEWEEYLMKKWYARYPASLFALAWAYVCYVAYTKGLDFGGKPLLYIVINPVIGIIMVVAAIFHAWEISLIVITLVVLYYLYLSIAALPISVAIIVASIIIAYGIYKYKA